MASINGLDLNNRDRSRIVIADESGVKYYPTFYGAGKSNIQEPVTPTPTPDDQEDEIIYDGGDL